MREKDLALLLVRHAVTKQGAQPDVYVEANEDSEVKAFGNAAIANSLEFLGKHGIVKDVQPTLSQRGFGFGYQIAPELIEELLSDDLILRRINDLFKEPTSETVLTLANVLTE